MPTRSRGGDFTLSARSYFRRKRTIRSLPRDLVTRYDLREANDDEIVLMKASAAKDRHAVKRLLAQYKASSALEILPHLPRQHVISMKDKLMNWLRRLEGSSEHDPLSAELRRMNRNEHYTIRHGYIETPLKEGR
jgi:hypothetical protein